MNQYFPDNVLTIPNATPETRDAAQYMLYKGKKQFNLCGHMSVAYCTSDNSHTKNIDDYLAYWEANAQPLWRSLFKGGLGRTTGVWDLTQMLSAYGITKVVPVNFVKMNVDAYANQLKTHRAILGVNIDYNGYLVGKGIPHWIVIEHIDVVDSNYAIVTIFNPFTNSMRPFSFKELQISSGASKYGLWVPR